MPPQTGRWGLLALGVMWGRSRYATLKKQEDAFRAEEAIQAPIRNAQLAKEKAAIERGGSMLFCVFGVCLFVALKFFSFVILSLLFVWCWCVISQEGNETEACCMKMMQLAKGF